MAERSSIDRPSMEDLELMATLNAVLPAASYEIAAKKTETLRRSYTRQGLSGAIERVTKFCNDDIVLHGPEGYDFTRTGRQFRDYALLILRAHREIRVWPPVYHIVIGASQRTATCYLPTFLKRFFQLAQIDGDSLPFQVSIRESDSREEFLTALRDGEADLGLRGLPVEDENSQATALTQGLDATPFGPVFRLLAVSKSPFEQRTVSVVDLLSKGRVGILNMDMESVLGLLSEAGEHVFLPQRNVLTCESYTAMMSFINHSLCTGLIYVPPHITSIPGFHFAELSDLSSSTRCFVFCKKSLSAKLDKLSLPDNRREWQRHHYLAALRNTFWDDQVQKEAFDPVVAPFLFM